MASNDYHFITDWYVDGTVEEIADILGEPLRLVEWWPAVYLDVTEVAPGDDKGIGRVIDMVTKGWLPYTLRWFFRVTEANYPHGFRLEAWGDFNGRGIWTLEQQGPRTHVIYDWQIRADKPLLRTFSFLLKPIFAANHHWAMATGETSLRLELARRRAKSEAERTALPPPPGPTSNRLFWLLSVVLIMMAIFIYLRSKKR